ncbi:DUF6415 family natural product biosynthesis protein [Streptomyces sp. NPDC059818]|uniref:DUF6415 family natural product biosynthesis protein n=1 Tax=unclassified Streptomyces TaxID=2593676 RepID=UPI003665F316|nr:DUF6415 family natural product biosynthesis protein [Streptomyces sp. NBC_00887]
MAALSAETPDKVEVLPLIEKALSWDLGGADLPAVGAALDIARQLTAYGRVVAEGLHVQCRSIPADSDARLGARATLGEANARLYLKPLAATTTPRNAAARAQNLARMVQALNRATARVGEEQAPTTP